MQLAHTQAEMERLQRQEGATARSAPTPSVAQADVDRARDEAKQYAARLQEVEHELETTRRKLAEVCLSAAS